MPHGTRRLEPPALHGRSLGPGAELEEFHLGGGAGGRESLFAFKQRFRPEGGGSSGGKLVHDEDMYRRLSGQSEIDLDGFFPPTAPRRARRNSD